MFHARKLATANEQMAFAAKVVWRIQNSRLANVSGRSCMGANACSLTGAAGSSTCTLATAAASVTGESAAASATTATFFPG